MKRFWSIVLALTLVLGMVPGAQAAESGYTDTAGHWAEAAITKWSDAGILQGSNGKFSPDNLITRGELAVVLDRVMKYQVKAQNAFTDLTQTWYTDAVLRANAAGILQGDAQKVRPLDNITRQEVAVMLCRGLKLAPKDGSTGFSDDAAIADWAKGAVKALADRKLVSGTGGNLFDPTAPMTRASVVKLLDNAVKGLYTKAGEYATDASGTVVVSAPGVTLKNMKIDGNLIIAEGVGEGEVHLDKITVTGDTIVKGGGEHSVYFNSVTVGGALIVNKVGGNLRIVATGTTSISVATLESGAILVTKDLVGGGIETVEIPASVAAGQKIVLDGDFKKVENSAKDVTMSATGKIAELVLNEKTTVEGSVKVDKVTTAPGADSVVSGKPIAGGKTEQTPATTPPSGGGGGGGGGDTPSVPTAVILAPGSLGTAGNGKITGLTAGKFYRVMEGNTLKFAQADGSLRTALTEIGALTGSELTGLSNGTTYHVSAAVPYAETAFQIKRATGAPADTTVVPLAVTGGTVTLTQTGTVANDGIALTFSDGFSGAADYAHSQVSGVCIGAKKTAMSFWKLLEVKETPETDGQWGRFGTGATASDTAATTPADGTASVRYYTPGVTTNVVPAELTGHYATDVSGTTHTRSYVLLGNDKTLVTLTVRVLGAAHGAAIAAIQNAENAAALKVALENTDAGLNLTVYSKLTDEGKTKVCGELFAVADKSGWVTRDAIQTVLDPIVLAENKAFAVSNLHFVGSEMMLTCTAPADETGVAGYRIRISIDDGATWEPWNGSLATSEDLNLFPMNLPLAFYATKSGNFRVKIQTVLTNLNEVIAETVSDPLAVTMTTDTVPVTKAEKTASAVVVTGTFNQTDYYFVASNTTRYIMKSLDGSTLVWSKEHFGEGNFAESTTVTVQKLTVTLASNAPTAVSITTKGAPTAITSSSETRCTVTFESNGGSAVAALSDVAPDSKITKPADPTKTEQGQALSFLGWFKDPALTQPWEFGTDTVSASMTLYAKWSGWQAPVERDARFAEGYPKASFNQASGKNVLELKVKLKTASAEAPVELFSTVNQMNSGYASSSLAVIHGHAESFGSGIVQVDGAPYLVISDTDEHTIPVANRSWDMRDMDISFVLRDQNATSPKPTVVTFNGTAMAELDTYAPHFANAYLNTAKNKVVLWFYEPLDTQSVPAPSAFTLSTGTVSAVAIPTPDEDARDGCVELTVSGIGEIAGLTVTYTQPAEGAAALQDSATTPNKVATFGTPRKVVSAVPAPGAISVSSDLAYIHATISPCPRFMWNAEGTRDTYDYTLKYGTDINSATLVENDSIDLSMSHSPTGNDADYFFEIRPEAVPTAAVEGGKYFVTLTPTATLKDCAGDRVTTSLELVGTPRATPEGSLQPTVAYNSAAKELQVVFPADHGLVTGYSSNCLFTITYGGKDYILRGGDRWSGENTRSFRADAFPFDPATFSWADATLSYSTAAHPNANAHDILHFDSGKPYAGFTNISITVTSAP